MPRDRERPETDRDHSVEIHHARSPRLWRNFACRRLRFLPLGERDVLDNPLLEHRGIAEALEVGHVHGHHHSGLEFAVVALGSAAVGWLLGTVFERFAG